MYSDRDDYARPDRTPRRSGGGFLDRGGSRGQRRRTTEKRRRVFKRTRAQSEETPEQRVIQTLLRLTENASDMEQTPGELTKEMGEHVRRFGDIVEMCLIDCIVELPTKTHHYATLLGRLCNNHGEWIDAFLKKVVDAFSMALAESECLRSRMLLRCLVALTSTGVLSPSSVSALLNTITESALTIARSTENTSGRSWQPYTDALIVSALLSLPWGGGSTFETASDWESFAGKVQEYVTCRPIQRDAALSPFLAPIKDNDITARSDSGGPSFIADLWSAVQELKSTGWECGSIPTASGRSAQIDRPRLVEGVVLPTLPPGLTEGMSIADKAAVMNIRYPPRGGLQLLEAQHTHPDAMEIDRIIVEQHIIDTLNTFQGSRVECVQRIAKDINAPFPICPLAAQTLFSQILMLPSPLLQPVSYSAVVIHLCKVTDDAWNVFPRGLSACVREIFARMDVLDPELKGRMADWLSLHLSNLGFMWPWNKWKRVIDAPEDDAQRQFVGHVLSNLVGLSYPKIVKENSPEEFHALLPREETANAFETLFSIETIEGDDPDRMDVDVVVDFDRNRKKLEGLREMISSKRDSETIREAFGFELDGDLDSVRAFARGLFRVLFSCGDKNITHTKNILDRYVSIVDEVIGKIENDCGVIAIDAAMDVWDGCVDRARLIVELLMTRGTASPSAVVAWVLNRLKTLSVDDLNSRATWEILDAAALFAESRVKEAKKIKDDAVDRLRQARASAEEAAERAAKAAASVESGTDNVQEMLDAINEANRSEDRARAEVIEADAHLRSMDGTALESATASLRSISIEIIRGFLTLLRDTSQSIDDVDRSRPYSRTLSRLGAFCRRQSGILSKGLIELEGTVEASGVDNHVGRVVFNSLRLGKDIDISEPMYDAHGFTGKRETA